MAKKRIRLLRRIAGATGMTLGGLLCAAGIALAGMLLTSYIEWENAEDALLTAGMVVGAVVGLGLVVLALGRLVYGAWRGGSPIRWAVSWLLLAGGAAAAAPLAGMFFFVVLTGVEPTEHELVVHLGAAVIVAVGVAIFGRGLRPDPDRRYRRRVAI